MEVILKTKQWPRWVKSGPFKLFAACLALFGCNRLYKVVHRKINNYPPGPYGLPFIGSLISMIFYSWNGFSKWHEMIGKYNKICLVYINNQPIVYINDLLLAKNLYTKNLTYRKPRFTLNFQELAFIDLNDDKWISRRHFNQHSLNVLINSKYIDTKTYQLIKNDFYPIIDNYASKDSKQKDYYFRDDLKYIMFTFIFASIYGNNVSMPNRNSTIYKTIVLNVKRYWVSFEIQLMIHTIFGNNFLLSPYLIDYATGFDTKCITKQIEILFREFFSEYKVNYDNDDIKNIENCYIKQQITKRVQKQLITEKQLLSDTILLIFVSMQTTLREIEKSLYWAAKNPLQQELVYNELKDYYQHKTKSNAYFELKDVKSLHFFRAFIYETIRINNINFGTLPRDINKDNISMNGYNIPINSTIYINTPFIHRNGKYFANPHNFDINHFLDNNKKFQKHSAFIPFGIGPRKCVGEDIAMREIYAILAPLFYRYKFMVPQHVKYYDIHNSTKKQLPLKVIKR